jgi:uncharacterized protein HemX
MKSGLILALLSTICFLVIGIASPTYGQQAPELPTQAPGEIECLQKLDRALKAIEEQKKLIAALEKRVKQLEGELADCKEKKEGAATP